VLGAGEFAVGVRDRVPHDDFGLLVERPQEPVEAERRTQGVAVRPHVRRDREAALRLDQLNDLTEHFKSKVMSDE
jgi:hypothetical protein